MTDSKIHPNLQLLIKIAVSEEDIQRVLKQLKLDKNSSAREYLDCLVASNLLIGLNQGLNNEKLKSLALLLQTKALKQEDLSDWFTLNASEQMPILLEIGERVMFSLS